MTKLQLLNQYLTERLMEAVREILEVVGDMISEYQEETARAQRENESLRRRLREVVFVAEAPWTETQEPAAPPVLGGRSPARQEVPALDWDARQKADVETAAGDGKREPCNHPCALDRLPAEEAAQEAPTPGLKKLALEIALSVVSPSSSVSAVHLAEGVVSGATRSAAAAEPEPLPGLRPELVKSEPGDVDPKPERLSEAHANDGVQDNPGGALCDAGASAACDTKGALFESVEQTEADQSILPPVPGTGSPTRREAAGLDWNSLREQDTETTPVDGKRDLHGHVIPLGVTTRRDSRELPESDWTAGRRKLTSGGPGFRPACRKNDQGQDAVELSDLFKIKIMSPAEVDSQPNVESGPFKTEPNGTNLSGADESGNLRSAEEPNVSEVVAASSAA
ncbi:hypothetical protein Z043_113159 [Scleropages formosus]|uniref:Uncharacterized protein n=1 Tax=Scleropages formosus TaxID=113540 RepID=A0A0P7U228_SCLFO|nr:hypothetical protein Z043_113159 [Scleropages formosus]